MKTLPTMMCALRYACGAVLLAGAVTPAVAEVYKQVRPDGSVIYTDKPVPGLKAQKLPQITEGILPRSEKPPLRAQVPGVPQMASAGGVLLPQLPPLPDVPGGRLVTSVPAIATPALQPDTTAPDRARAIAQAEVALSKALQAQKDGIEPQDGDRTGTAHGGSRLNQGYEKRQQDLADAVSAARQVLKDAQGR